MTKYPLETSYYYLEHLSRYCYWYFWIVFIWLNSSIQILDDYKDNYFFVTWYEILEVSCFDYKKCVLKDFKLSLNYYFNFISYLRYFKLLLELNLSKYFCLLNEYISKMILIDFRNMIIMSYLCLYFYHS